MTPTELHDELERLGNAAISDELHNTEGNIWRVIDDGRGNPEQDLVAGGDPPLTELFVAYRRNHDLILRALSALSACEGAMVALEQAITVFESKEMLGLVVLAELHHCPYTGPQFDADEARSAIAMLAASSPRPPIGDV